MTLLATGITASEPDARPDLEARVETKFPFPGADVAALRARLLRGCRRIAYAGAQSVVSSLYLDDERLGCCRANLDGVGLRHKTRLRWYDRERPGTGAVFFETKWRRHRLTGKRRTPIRSDVGLETLDFAALHRSLTAALSPEGRDHLARDRVAVVLIRYRREHFVLDGGAARLTLDHDLRFVPQLGRRRLSFTFAHREPALVLVESKTRPGDEAALRDVARLLDARPGRCSKYVTACQSLGLASRP